MQYAEQLTSAGLNVFPCIVTRNEARNKWEKRPRTPAIPNDPDGKHESWQLTAERPLNDPAVNWHGCTVLGLPIPVGVVVVDMDTYKDDCSRGAVEAIIGQALPWDFAQIQTTIGGGEHYAFQAPAWKVKQGSNFGKVGLDTRIGGKGFICSGEGYTPTNGFGVLRMAAPESLPVLPDCFRDLLEDKAPEQPTAPTNAPTPDSRSTEDIVAALHFVDPGMEHDAGWIRVIMALHNEFREDMDTGFAIADAWSSGAYWSDGMPGNYEPESVRHQFYHGTKADGGVTMGSVFFQAIQGGWQPPSTFDTSAAFGDGAAPVDTFNDLVVRIAESGTDSRAVPDLLAAIAGSGCNALQTGLLRNELKAALKSAGLLDAGMRELLDQSLTPNTASLGGGELYGKNHTENAGEFLNARYPNNTLLRSDEVWYAYTGKAWEERNDADIDAELTRAMLSSRPQKSVVTGTYGMLASMSHRPGLEMSGNPPGLILFQNGALDLATGLMYAHDPQYMTTKIMPYNYTPNAQAPTWVAFVNSIFEGDQERVELLQEWLGYMISPSYLFQKVMLLIGPRRCGKGTIGRIMEHLVGEQNFTGGSLKSFASDSFLDSLRSKTVLFSGDTAKSINRMFIDTVIENIKKISGNDAVTFDRKYKSSRSCTLPTRITLAGNHVPKLFDDSEALSSRLLVIPFQVSFYNREDLTLTDKLLAEIEGIAAWALQGLARLNASGRFTNPAASQDEVQFITEAYSPLRLFIDSVCTMDADAAVCSTELYNAYRAWAVSEQEEHLLPRKTFISAFKDATRGQRCTYGTHRIDGKPTRGFRGVSLGHVSHPAAAQAFGSLKGVKK